MARHLVLDVIALADQGKTREQIAEELGVTIKSVTNRLAYAKRAGMTFLMPPRKRRMRSDAAVERSGEAVTTAEGSA